MADLIQIKGGDSGKALQDREIAYHRRERELYIGTPDGNVRLSSVFYAEYGVTAGEDIGAALQAGKLVVCFVPSGDHAGRILQLVADKMTGEAFRFACFDYPISLSAEVNSGVWSQITAHDLSAAQS